MSEKVGVVLLNLGGPETTDDIEPFLTNLFNDPDIIDFPLASLFRERLARFIVRRRGPYVRLQYNEIGGGSPLRKNTVKQAELLESRLNRHFNAVVLVAMRYWEPFTAEAIAEIERQGIGRVVLLPLYPQYSTATTFSSVKEWKTQVSIKGLGRRIDWSLIESYCDNERFAQAFVERINQGLERFPAAERENVRLMFSAHGIPVKLVKAGDPYPEQIKRTADMVMKLGEFKNPHDLCYQSKVGPQKWLKPFALDEVVRLAKNGEKYILTVPIAFVSDHLETLYEIGIKFRKLAEDNGVRQFEVTEGLNDSELFISALENLVLAHLDITADEPLAAESRGAAN